MDIFETKLSEYIYFYFWTKILLYIFGVFLAMIWSSMLYLYVNLMTLRSMLVVEPQIICHRQWPLCNNSGLFRAIVIKRSYCWLCVHPLFYCLSLISAKKNFFGWIHIGNFLLCNNAVASHSLQFITNLWPYSCISLQGGAAPGLLVMAKDTFLENSDETVVPSRSFQEKLSRPRFSA